MIEAAVILAGGRGERMWPYGETRSKATLPVLNSPAIAHQVRNLTEVGVKDFTVVLGHLGQQVRSAVAREGVEANFVEHQEFDGPAGGLAAAADQIERDGFFVVHGDTACTVENYRELLDVWDGDSEAAALVQDIEKEEAGDWFTASIAGGELEAVHAHSRGGPSRRLCGIYIMTDKALSYAKNHPGMTTRLDVGAMPPIEADLSQTLQDMVDSGETVKVAESRGVFVDMDKPWHLLEANMRMAGYINQGLEEDDIAEGAEISEEAEISGPIRVGPNSRIGKRVVIGGNVTIGANTSITNGAMIGSNIVIGDHCKIRDYSQLGSGSVLGDNCVMGHCAEFGGLLMNKVYLYHYCELSGVIGTATDIGAATVCGTLRFDDGRTTHEVKGRKETPLRGSNATYIGEYCRTGVNAIIMPGVKVGPYSVLGPGTIVYEDIPERTMLLAKQEQVKKGWGPEKYGW